MIKVLIADDHTLVRKGLKQILLDTEDIESVDEAGNGKETISKVTHEKYDLVLLDITLPGRSGIDVLKQIKCIDPELPVLILSMHPEEQYAVRSLRAGAAGYLTKESAPQELLNAIRRVANGGKYISSSLAEKLAGEIGSDMGKPLHEILSDREYQVMCLIASGKTAKEIAEDLNLSVKTISTHRARILRKMQMDNNAQITHYAIKRGLVV
ncbi:MAG: response regulator transcription factor [Candidatus Aminicenantes bacterium]|nr:MAG: response regulator transcription factor [Candidatus Aminicenantes bacterium]